ncbi:unnamed protein product, partial [Iphiclides podalirius]
MNERHRLEAAAFGVVAGQKQIIIEYESRTVSYQIVSGNQRALASISRYLIQAHKDADSPRISDDSRDKWARAQPKYGAGLNKKVRRRGTALCNQTASPVTIKKRSDFYRLEDNVISLTNKPEP